MRTLPSVLGSAVNLPAVTARNRNVKRLYEHSPLWRLANELEDARIRPDQAGDLSWRAGAVVLLAAASIGSQSFFYGPSL